jgi:competence protein ComEA
VDYLAKNFGKGGGGEKVNVNKAAAKDIETGLALTTKEAEAIVAYRQKNGDFKTLQDLLKVTGVDAKRIEAAKDKIDF